MRSMMLVLIDLSIEFAQSTASTLVARVKLEFMDVFDW
jgi:hypothetical protein